MMPSHSGVSAMSSACTRRTQSAAAVPSYHRRVCGIAQPLARPAAASPRLMVHRLSGVSARVPLKPLCASGLAHPEGARQEDGSCRSSLPVFLSVPNVTVAKGGGGGSQDMGSGGSLGAQVLERSKINIVMPTPVVHGPKLDDTGNGGDMGNHNNVGGGDGSGGGGDDDDYSFNDGEGEEGDGEGGRGESFFKMLIPELFDRASLGAVLSEWFKTVAELPLIIRRAVEMGLFSSAQLTRFLSMDVRPNIVRTVARQLPTEMQSQLVGRLMADPGFVHKMMLETVFAAASSLYYEMQARGDRFRKELDLVAINTLGMAAAAGMSLWLVAPSRAYGALHKFPWQQMLHSLPNCVFDSSGPLRSYTHQARLGGWVAKMGELAGVGAVTGAATALLSQGAVALRQKLVDPDFEPSVAPPSMWASSAGLASFFALNAHTRYQLIGGMDKYLFDHSHSLLTYLGITMVARIASNRLGEISRPSSQGLPDSQTVAVHARQQRRRAVLAAQYARRQQQRKAQRAAAAAAVTLPQQGVEADLLAFPAPSSSGDAALEHGSVASSSGSYELQTQVDAAVASASTSRTDAEREAFGFHSSQGSISGQESVGGPASMSDAALAADLAAAAANLGGTATAEDVGTLVAAALPVGVKRAKEGAMQQA